MNTITRWGLLAVLTFTGRADESAGPITRQAYIKASNSGMHDQFGGSRGSIALAGDTLVVGAEGEDSSAKQVDGDQGDGLDPYPLNPQLGFEAGAAYVFSRYGSGWSQEAYLKSTDTASNDLFGRAVAVSGDTAAVTAPGADGKQAGVAYRGAVYVFVREGKTWRQQARLTVPGGPGVHSFGSSVAICGETVVVGVDGESGAAAGGKAGDDGELMAGAAYVFVRDGGKWSQQARLEAPKPSYKAHFGTSVAISGDTVVVGAIGDNSAAGGVNGDPAEGRVNDAGAAHVFVRDGATWSQQAFLKAPRPMEFDHFGISVAISGETAVVGAADAGAGSTKPGANGDGRANIDDGPGAAFVFVRDGDRWSAQASLMPPEFKGGEEFGSSVAISGDQVVVGAAEAGGRGKDRRNLAGEAYVFIREAATWDRGTRILASNAESGDRFGGAVAISGGTVAVGAGGEDGMARGVNGNEGEDFSGNPRSGAAYAFEIPGIDPVAAADAGAGMGTLEKQIIGYWATDWNAMAKSWQPLVEGLVEMKGFGPGHKDRAAEEKAAVEEFKAGFAVATMEVKKGEMIDRIYSGKPDRKTYRIHAEEAATGKLELEVSGPDGKAAVIQAVLSGDRLTLTEAGGEEQSLPMIFRRIAAAEFEARCKKAAESK